MATSSGSQEAPLISTTTPSSTESENLEASPVDKIYVILNHNGDAVGPTVNAARFIDVSGERVRGKIPIHFKDWRLKELNVFKKAVWDELLKEFYFNVPEVEARRLLDSKFNATWRNFKSRMRRDYIKRNQPIETTISIVPPKVDPIHWRTFVLDEFKPETIVRNEKNKKNRANNKYSHTMGRYSYARKLYEMEKANPGKQHTRDEVWTIAHERKDGTILPSAKESYEKVKAVQEKRKDSGDTTYVPIESDVLTEALGADKKRTRVLSNRMSLNQYTKVHSAKLVYEKPPDKDKEVSELKNTLAEMQAQNQQILKMFQQFVNGQTSSAPPPVDVSTTSSDAVGSNSNHRGTPPNLINAFGSSNHRATPQNLLNAFGSVTPSSRPKVELLGRDGSIVAKGWVATDIPSKICHGKTILPFEKRVYVEEVLVADAPIYERPQDNMMTMQEISEGGYLIWPDALLQAI